MTDSSNTALTSASSFADAEAADAAGNNTEESKTLDVVSYRKPKISKAREKENKKYECKVNPAESKWWLRSVDAKQNATYYNVNTGESRWLPPCGICKKPGKKWCLTCKGCYCAEDFAEYHDNTEWYTHKWSHQEPCKRAILDKGEVYCTECNLVAATKMCIDCWDPYCKRCFKLVHTVGLLKTHRKKDYSKAVAGWMPLVGTTGTKVGQEYYHNGTTGESTFNKPTELHTPTEKFYFEGFKKYAEEIAKQHEIIDKLQFDLEETSYEVDKAHVELDKATKINNKKMEQRKAMEKVK